MLLEPIALIIGYGKGNLAEPFVFAHISLDYKDLDLLNTCTWALIPKGATFRDLGTDAVGPMVQGSMGGTAMSDENLAKIVPGRDPLHVGEYDIDI